MVGLVGEGLATGESAWAMAMGWSRLIRRQFVVCPSCICIPSLYKLKPYMLPIKLMEYNEDAAR